MIDSGMTLSVRHDHLCHKPVAPSTVLIKGCTVTCITESERIHDRHGTLSVVAIPHGKGIAHCLILVRYCFCSSWFFVVSLIVLFLNASLLQP